MDSMTAFTTASYTSKDHFSLYSSATNMDSAMSAHASSTISTLTQHINHTLNSNTSQWNSEVCQEIELVDQIIPILVYIFFSIIAITGFFGNSLVILVVAFNSHMQSTTNLLIVNLACADLLFVIFCIPFTAFDYVVYEWPFGLAWCKMVQYIIVVTCLASVYTLVLMSIDRFLAIVYPVRSRSIRTEFLTKVAIAILWLTILIVSLPVIMLHEPQIYEECGKTWLHCAYAATPFMSKESYTTIFFATSYVLPLVLITVLYIKIVSRIWHKCRMSTESQRGRRRVTRVVVVVVLAFALLWLPIQIILVLQGRHLTPLTAFFVVTQVIAQTIAYASSCINPILYAFLSENFRKAFRKVIYFSSSYRFGPSKQYNDLSTTSTAAAPAANRRISAVQDSVAII